MTDLHIFITRHLAFEEAMMAHLEDMHQRLSQRLQEQALLVSTLKRAALTLAPPLPTEARPLPKGGIQWANENQKIFLVASQERIEKIAKAIDEGRFNAPTATGGWRKKHHPLAEIPALICAALREAPEQALSRAEILAAIDQMPHGRLIKDSPDGYLRELFKQHIIDVE